MISIEVTRNKSPDAARSEPYFQDTAKIKYGDQVIKSYSVQGSASQKKEQYKASTGNDLDVLNPVERAKPYIGILITNGDISQHEGIYPDSIWINVDYVEGGGSAMFHGNSYTATSNEWMKNSNGSLIPWPGSMGCVVLRKADKADFSATLKELGLSFINNDTIKIYYLGNY